MTTPDEREWTVDWFLAECERVEKNPPPAPEGMELVECDAEPRHWPIYVAHIDGMYPAHCIYCEAADLSKRLREIACQRGHRRWKSWSIWSRISSRLYVLGVTASGGGTSYGRCEFCGIGRQHTAPRWRGKRSYFLGRKREEWACLMRGHRHSPTDYGLCSICCPCPSCGSPDPAHAGDCGTTS